MNDQEIWALFNPLWDDLKAQFKERPLLAHYTSIQVLEKILSTNEVWFSNPLLMNDLQEVRFGIIEGTQVVLNNLNNADVRKALGDSVRLLARFF